jgi:RHS repeat-associated protein
VITDYQGREFIYKEYTPYGELWLNEAVDPARAGVIGFEHGFTGHIHDSETGLIFANARYLDPTTTRWLSSDPIRADGTNWFRYANNNPLKYTDPTGLEAEEVEQVTNLTLKQFRKLNGEEQMAYLQSVVDRNGNNYGEANQARGNDAAHLRELRGGMKFGALFKANESFMNEGLRDFMNLNLDGSNVYSMADLEKQGFKEMSSVGSQYHQSSVAKGGALNAKFVHKDGREIVMSSGDRVVNERRDKGTYNYVNGNLFSSILWGGHNLYDIKPYMNHMARLGNTRENGKINLQWSGTFSGLFVGNSKSWG